MDYHLALVISAVLVLCLITIILFCAHVSLVKIFSKQINKLRCKKKIEKKELIERISKRKKDNKAGDVHNIELSTQVKPNKSFVKINKIDESLAPSAAYMNQRKRSSSMTSYPNQDVNFTLSSSEYSLTDSDSDLSSVNDIKISKQEVSKRNKQLLKVMSEANCSIERE